MLADLVQGKKVELYEASLGKKSAKAFIYIVDMNALQVDIMQFMSILSSQEISKAQSYYTQTLVHRYIIWHC